MLMEIIEKEDLNYEEAIKIFDNMANGKYSEAQIASILTSIKLRGENPEIIRAAINVFNSYKIKLELGDDLIDTCGTGGDGKHSVNVSSAVALTLAALGKKVVKHGNKAQTGKVGSADIFEMVGIPTELKKDEAISYFNKHNFVFIFAPLYHPAFKYVAPVRKQLGFPTIFNYLGPFLNPATPSYQMVGMNKLDKLGLIKDSVIGNQYYKKVIIYSSYDGYDEISTSDITVGYEIEGNYFKEFKVDPKELFNPFLIPSVVDKNDAFKLFMDGLSGENEKIASLISINTAVGLYLTGDVKSIKEGYNLAYKAIKKGDVVKKINELKR